MHNYTQPYSDFVSAIRKIKAGHMERLSFDELLAINERYETKCKRENLYFGPLPLLRWVVNIGYQWGNNEL